jgi:hypothetical protein
MNLCPAHGTILRAALRAPSAHNAQPWRLTVAGPDAYEVHYDHLDYLPYDPDDRDAYLAIGAFLETLDLAAQRHGHRIAFEPVFTRTGSDLFVGVARLRRALPGEVADPLAAPAAFRQTNRCPVPASGPGVTVASSPTCGRGPRATRTRRPG